MVGMDKIVGVQEPTLVRGSQYAKPADSEIQPVTQQAAGQNAGSTTKTSGKDEVELSPKAREMADAMRLFQQSQADEEERAKQVKQVREAIEKGATRVQQVLLVVASRVSKYLQSDKTTAGNGAQLTGK